MIRNAACLAALFVLGCGSKNAADNGAIDIVSKTEVSKVDGGVPAAANTAALRWIGFPFDRPVYYRMEGFQDTTLEGSREYKITPGADNVTIDVIWTGDMSSALGQSEQWIAEAAGIRSSKIQGNDIKPSPIYLPADPRKGSTWDESYSFDGVNSQGKIAIKSKSTILGTESIKVPAGTYQALVLKETGTMSASTTTASLDGKTWFVEGLGMVKAVQHITRTPKGEKPSKVTITITAIPKPKE